MSAPKPQHPSAPPPQTRASAPGKVILLGEHAVVYGRPAIAAPVWEAVATAEIGKLPIGSGCILSAPDIDHETTLADASDEDALALLTRLALKAAGATDNPDWRIELHSEIPIASGMGSGAALGAALVRAIFTHAGQEIAPQTVSGLVYESEKLFHGTPSGIDNTVVAYGQPVWFVKGDEPVVFSPKTPFTLAIADSGIASPTKTTVGDVRAAWQRDPASYEAIFDEIAAIVIAARTAIELGDIRSLGTIFDRNQIQLQKLDVSSPALERLIEAARHAGALGAKLSGGGRGGNIIALVEDERAPRVEAALLAAGARRVIVTTVA